MTPPDINNSPQDPDKEALRKIYNSAKKLGPIARKIISTQLGVPVDMPFEVFHEMGKELGKKAGKEISKKYEVLKLAIREQLARKAIDDALAQLKAKEFQDIFAKKGIALRSTDFYLAIAHKESNFNQQAKSNVKTKNNGEGLFQIFVTTDEEGNESSKAIDDINRFYGLKKTTADIFCEKDDPKAREKATQENALAGILFWHMCRDNYGQKMKPSLSSDDKDKVANMGYNMSPTVLTRLWKAMGDPKDFTEFATELAKKLHKAFPNDLKNKTESIEDAETKTSYTSYVEIGKDFNPIGKELGIDGEKFGLAKIFQALKYSELVFSMMNSPVKPKEAAKEAPKAPALIPAFYTLGEEFKNPSRVAEDFYDKSEIEKKMPDFETKYPKREARIVAFTKMILEFNKDKKDFEKVNSKFTNLQKGAKIYIPKEDFILKYFGYGPKPVAEKAPVKVVPLEKIEKTGPSHVLNGQLLMITDSMIPSFFTIDTQGVKGKIKLKQAVNVSNDGKGKNFERDCIQVQIDGLEGYFQMESSKNLSLFPLDKGGLWDNYDLHLDSATNVIMIHRKIPYVTPEKQVQKAAPIAAPSQAPKPAQNPTAAPSSAPGKISEKNDVMPKGVPIYSGPAAEELERIGKETIKYLDEKGKQIDLNTPPCELRIPNKPYTDKPMDINNPPMYDKKTFTQGKYHGEKMEEKNVKYIVLHATLGVGENLEKNAEKKGIHETQGAHYLVRKDGTVENLAREWIDPTIKDEKERKAQKRIALNHAGFNDSNFGSVWNDEQVTYESIGIEVEAAVGEEYNEAQYAALKPLIEWIGARYKIPKANVLTHSMIASHPTNGRGRKADPSRLKWSKLGLPDNYRRIDPDVATGKAPSNIGRIKSDIKNKENDWGLSNADENEITGLEASHRINNERIAAAKKAKKK